MTGQSGSVKGRIYLFGFSGEEIFLYVIQALVFLLIIPIHESAHGLAALWFGDDTAKRKGRISLNPFVHLDIVGLVVMLFAGVGWAKPVPVNISNMKRRRLGMAAVSLAGPLSNFICAFLGAAAVAIISGFTLNEEVEELSLSSGFTASQIAIVLLMSFVQLNVVLGLFNLIPLPPLDGFNLVRSFAPLKLDRWIYRNYRYINGAFIALILIAHYFPDVWTRFYIVEHRVESMIWDSVSWIYQLFV